MQKARRHLPTRQHFATETFSFYFYIAAQNASNTDNLTRFSVFSVTAPHQRHSQDIQEFRHCRFTA